MMDETGGPAFPTMTISESVGRAGMTLWDYYAGQALIGIAGREWGYSGSDAATGYAASAGNAAKYADAMMTERTKRSRNE